MSDELVGTGTDTGQPAPLVVTAISGVSCHLAADTFPFDLFVIPEEHLLKHPFVCPDLFLELSLCHSLST